MPTTMPSDSDADEDGLELERQADEPITRPFNPEEIQVRTIPVLVDQLVSRVNHQEIELAPDFQRQQDIWGAPQKGRLIESLLLRIPIPVFYVAADEDETWSVVDGLQRTSTIHGFVAGEFPLKGLEYLTQFEKHHYQDLPRPMQRRVNETQLTVNVIEPGTPEDVMFNIFRRINTGGTPLTAQEIRNALHRGAVHVCLKELAASKEFLAATDNAISVRRMADRECVLRFLAFHLDPWESYEESDLDTFLGKAMRKINRMSVAQRDTLAVDFRRAMRAAHRVFGKDAFRKRYSATDKRKPVSKALFESWSVGLARRTDRELQYLVMRKAAIRRRAQRMLNEDRDFADAISYATGTPSRIRKRFQAVDKLIEESLQC